ncbi:flagellar biosynthesis protein FlhF [Peribacillus glennii]|uniref:Flagellar biosynthesis protein FlhF n=1 Tax=Peribacillus glennii TaxID=2303991 RepID=A0A372L935_9BACI|nr:flagellar biosynthesis protein FlhF [Peribacillus glennii]RFU61544.1 flagellar biosynthesis protein FlhF [Peribacillus glennii]
MKVKKYLASSMSEAMKDIRQELGNDAVILSSKPVYSSGFLGLFRKRNIEVVAAIDPSEKHNPPIKKQKQKKMPAEKTVSAANPGAESEQADSGLKIHSPAPESEQAKSLPAGEILKELAQLREMVKGINYESANNDKKYPDPLQEIYKTMEKQEIDCHIRAEMMDALLTKWFSGHHDSPMDEITGWLKAELDAKISAVSDFGGSFEKKYINIVGPTGVGKTTTLAKIAAESILKQNKKVAFITTDTYRIAAIDQLQTYAKILNVPIEVAYNLVDFKNAAEKFSHYDLVFIDTAGRNFRNHEYVRDLQKIIDFEREMETYLVLSLTAKQRDMEEIFMQFSTIPIKQVIFTKADETASFGPMLNFIIKHRIGAAYITNGQDVPDDIEKASPRLITEIILGANKK